MKIFFDEDMDPSVEFDNVDWSEVDRISDKLNLPEICDWCGEGPVVYSDSAYSPVNGVKINSLEISTLVIF
ncbi:TPA: hypothetical protein DCG86_00185 [Candidatus Marinimicrobia bacterium]|nr:hypothetical protein [Candidatus Neomarinimicrobiota bacterium]